LTGAFSQLVFDLEGVIGTARSLVVMSDDMTLATRTAARVAERLGHDGRSVRVVSSLNQAARITTSTNRRATPAATRSVLVQPERTQGVAWTGEYGSLAPPREDAITIRAVALADLATVALESPADLCVVLAVRLGTTPSRWLVAARAAVDRTAMARVAGVVIWAADIEESNDPVSFALDAALRPTPPVLSAIGR
jgi:hypothetical protein